jgi:hypothetical protein
LKRVCDKLLGGISKKTLVIILALTVTMVTAAGGTLAFLYGTQNVKNTFTYGDIQIDLEETDTGLDPDQNPDTNQYPMLPGQPIHKDPKVTVYAGSLDSWLFVELTESWNFADYLAYTVADGWEPLEGVPGVFCRAVDASSESQTFPVIKDDLIYMKESVTLGQLATLTDADYPTLAIKAYAIQRSAAIEETATAQSAWTLLQTVQ